ncbi:uridine kinase family protein [Homoserinimonas sp. A520]
MVGISGYAGSGKSTLTRDLLARVDGSVRIRGDDFLDPTRSHHRSADWDGVDRIRLLRQVIVPFRSAQKGSFQRFDWSTRTLANPEPLPDAAVLIIDCIGLFHSDLEGAFDLTIWVDAEPGIAAQRGRERDHDLGRQHDALWEDVWVPNDRDFDETFKPREVADIIFLAN